MHLECLKIPSAALPWTPTGALRSDIGSRPRFARPSAPPRQKAGYGPVAKHVYHADARIVISCLGRSQLFILGCTFGELDAGVCRARAPRGQSPRSGVQNMNSVICSSMFEIVYEMANFFLILILWVPHFVGKLFGRHLYYDIAKPSKLKLRVLY